MVEQSTVNRLVPGSSPGRGALNITLICNIIFLNPGWIQNQAIEPIRQN